MWHPHNDVVASCSYDNKIKMYKEDDDDWVKTKELCYNLSLILLFAY